MLSLIALATLAPTGIDTVNLVRAYKTDEIQAYALEVTMEHDGQSQTISSEVVFKVKKITDEGAEVAMSTRKFTMKSEGNDLGHPLVDDMTAPFDKLGLPHVMETDNEAWVYIVSSFAGFVPGKEVELGKGFDIAWTSKDKNLAVTGKGNAKELVEADGAKAVKIEYDVEVKPGQDSPGTVKCTTLVAADGSAPISCEGTVAVDGGTMKFKVKRLKS